MNRARWPSRRAGSAERVYKLFTTAAGIISSQAWSAKENARTRADELQRSSFSKQEVKTENLSADDSLETRAASPANDEVQATGSPPSSGRGCKSLRWRAEEAFGNHR